ncbi:hypothetical protein [Massilia aquatica]|uniref:Uncharacterized protein n=1 Tax=Massilia aquatica TaxID=2609000 RepID=A0ABX0M2G5_9BURK|nr:hypothetical protein [Massilia aquatica]NHZ39213.1 hypothetical protein [Massilia aquatica]
MTLEDSIKLYGLRPPAREQLDQIRNRLAEETEQERRVQGKGDTELAKLCCVQLFSHGMLEDILRIWHAKTASMDAYCGIDIQLLCGAGLNATKEYLQKTDSDSAQQALLRIAECESAGDFDGFTIDGQMGFYEDYYS